MQRLVFLLLWSPFSVQASLPQRITLGEGFNEIVQVPALARVAVGRSQIATVRALPPDEILVTGKRVGMTSLQVWLRGGGSQKIEVVVLPLSEYRELGGKGILPVIQVSLEFLEIDSSLNEELGLHWPQPLQFSAAGRWEETTGLNYSVIFSSAQGFLNALIQQGWAKLLARPELFVRLGEEATFHSGGELPVPTSRSSYGRSHQHIDWKPYGLSVKVRPQSANGLMIGSDIEVDISEINRSVSAQGVPAFIRRKLNTKMNSKNGETVILSGLIRSQISQEQKKVPVLGELPFLGELFTNKGNFQQETELLMAVTFSLATQTQNFERRREFQKRFEKNAPG